ncbi:MAG: Omp28-related outer membrane protein [Bacteroidota bacterium]
MKKQILTLLAAGATGSMFAQLPVSTTPQTKRIVLEEFTGIHCGYCPDGHTIANNIYNNNPGKVILINIHSGSFANAAAGEQDLKSTMGTAIDAMPGMGITGYPAGAVNRTVLAGSVMAAGRGSWTSMSNTIKAQNAYCNVAVEGSVDAVTRVLTYTAQVYYTANSPVTSNSLTVMLLEDKVLGLQSNYGTPTPYNATNYNADGTYNHNHVLRKGLTTGNFGITIPVTTTGTTFTTTGTYTIPATFGAAGKTTPCLLGNIELAAFVTQTNSLTINGAYGPINITNIANSRDAAVNNVLSDAEVCAGNLQSIKFNLANNGSSNMTSAAISYSVGGGTVMNYNFAGNLAPFTQTVITLPAYSFVASATNTLNVAVTSVNGSTDQNAVNDVAIKSIPLTTKVANNANLTMEFTQDAYGTESTWEIREEVSNTLVASGGPYSNLGVPDANGNLPAATQLNTQAFTVTSGMCYKVIVNDGYGDGFNAGFGAGNYKIKDGTITVYTMNGVMASTDLKLFKTSVFTGIAQTVSTVANISVYPSPAKNAATLSLDLVQNENISISVVNAVGQIVYTESLNNLQAGNHVVNFNTENWASGIYNINISTNDGTTNRKLVIAK